MGLLASLLGSFIVDILAEFFLVYILNIYSVITSVYIRDILYNMH